jgi:GT2 family glycosyltransferase
MRPPAGASSPGQQGGGGGAAAGAPVRVQVLLTAHDRRELTLTCLERLASQGRDGRVQLGVILVDDASTDGTAAAVRQRFPEVRLVEGNGSLYWNGGMRKAFDVAMGEDPDFYLLLNDDTRLVAGALDAMLAVHAQRQGAGETACIVVGTTVDPATGAPSYGGWLRGPWFNPVRLQMVQPGTGARPCHTMNCNCVLVPREVARRVGNLDPVFTHRMGDLDYGLRALEAGCTLWVAPGFVGECAANTGKGLWVEPALGARQLWRRLLGPKGLPPGAWLTFTSRHSGPFWPAYFAWPYLKYAWRTLRGLARPAGPDGRP